MLFGQRNRRHNYGIYPPQATLKRMVYPGNPMSNPCAHHGVTTYMQLRLCIETYNIHASDVSLTISAIQREPFRKIVG
jgi:hypothetical protein